MPYPYTKYRSRNRTRVDQRIPPFASAVAGPTGADASAASATFPSPMDTTITAIPAGWTVDGKQVTSLIWSTSTVAIIATGTAFVAGNVMEFPATNVIRSANGGSTQASSVTLVA